MLSTKKKRTGSLRQTKETSDQHVDLKIFTIGHATRPVSELVLLLHEHNVTTLVDIRTIPRSRTNPQHKKANLQRLLPANGINYIWLGEELGGLRKLDKSLGDLNAGWYNASFRGYADYMQSSEFAAGFQELCKIAEDTNENNSCAIMCAETYYRRCHRSLVSDALVVHGYKVLHIVAPGKPAVEHQMTQFAKVERVLADKKKVKGEVIKITYPAYEGMEDEIARKKSKKQPKIDSFLKKKKEE